MSYAQEPSYTVHPGKSYRFRVIGAMETTVSRISIDGHKLIVMATDGYLTKPFDVDVLHFHVGERYDFMLKTRSDVDPGTIFPIRVESVDVYCNNHNQPSRVGIAYLKYYAPVIEDRCTSNECVALNCPFAHYPVVEDVENTPAYTCFNVNDALSLLHPTPDHELPDDTYLSQKITNFFNFAFHNRTARINEVQFDRPTIPFAMTEADEHVTGECFYNTTECSKACPHAVYLQEQYKGKSMQFVLSSLPRGKGSHNSRPTTKIITHPIHLHGHSFWVVKIAYPIYFANGTIERVNEDVNIPDCGHASWKDNIQSPGIKVDQYTIRKDVITIPAGGYVVIAFLNKNPGWWFMHCHIYRHLLEGMAIAVGELPECQNPPPKELVEETSREVCITVKQFKDKEANPPTCMEGSAESKLSARRLMDKIREKDRVSQNFITYF